MTERKEAPRIAYVVASWGGARKEPGYDATKIIRGHFEQLDSLATVSETILVVPDNTVPNAEGYDEAIEEIVDGNPGIRLLRRPNVGLSYGSFSDAFHRYRKEFDYWIFYEDDYYPVGDEFDRTWAELYERARRETEADPEEELPLGFLCGWISHHYGGLHAGVSNGVTSTDVLEKIWARFGALPNYHKNHVGDWTDEWFNSQVGFSKGFTKTGHTIQDVIRYGYRTPFYNSRKKELVYTGQAPDMVTSRPELFFPGQVWERRIKPR